MTRKEAITLIKSAQLMLINPTTNEPVSDLYEALDMAIKALSQINDIKAIINNTMYIQEDVLRYQMICEVVKE